jgi:hypothetical protein
MLCHECMMAGEERPAVALCKFCQVGLCKEHLVALYREPAMAPQYSCHHNPAGLPRRAIDVKAAPREYGVVAREPDARELVSTR